VDGLLGQMIMLDMALGCNSSNVPLVLILTCHIMQRLRTCESDPSAYRLCSVALLPRRCVRRGINILVLVHITLFILQR
jgi:hypothetical protein